MIEVFLTGVLAVNIAALGYFGFTLRMIQLGIERIADAAEKELGS